MEVFGQFIGEPLTADEHPLEVIGIVKYMDVDGDVLFQPFRSSTLSDPEAYGMIRMAQIMLDDDLDTSMYMTGVPIDWDDDDD